MPIYEFRCLECGHLFEKLFLDASEQIELICPECVREGLTAGFSRGFSAHNDIYYGAYVRFGGAP